MPQFPAPLYFTDSALDAVESGGVVDLDGPEGHHATAVRRLRVGEQVSIGDGRGTVCWGTVAVADKSGLQAQITQRVAFARPRPEIVLVQALAKGGRDELAIQAATEIGVDRIVPWAAARSVVKWDAKKAQSGVDRWRSIVREAAKQSLRAFIPEVDPVTTTRQLGVTFGADMLVLDPAEAVRFADAVSARPSADRVVIVVGPEGGIDSAELQQLHVSGAVAAVLGETVLRTSTAGPAAAALAMTLTGRW